ncbi:MAG: primosomal protein N' [Bacteroidota bacterium]
MAHKTLFVDVILPLPLPKLYTYRVPFELNDTVEIGKRVVVQFGKKKIYAAIIENTHQKAPAEYEAKYILSVLDPEPVINSKQLKHWKWISSYYMCSLGEVMNAAIPSGLKLASETKLELNPDFSGDYSILNDKEYMIVEALELQSVLSIDQAAKVLGQITILPYIKSLIEKEVVLVQEELINRYKPKMETCVRLTGQVSNEDALRDTFDKLEKAPKQLELLMSYIGLSKKYSKKTVEINRPTLLKSVNVSSNTLEQLIKKGIFEIYQKEIGRLNIDLQKIKQPKRQVKLNKSQKAALKKTKKEFIEKDVVLLHGVTSSGKTEIYIKLIEETLKKGKQVLYLLPEIALTTQIINRLEKHFGNKIGVYHSKFNDNERVEIWNSVQKNAKQTDAVFETASVSNNTYDIILGARSAIFLPYDNLGLVIVDEEHENSYKQIDPSPRYNGRDASIYLAHLHRAKTLLGSATPSLESYYNVESGKYGLVEIMERYGEMQMPEIILVNIKEESRKRRMKSHFSPFLLELIQQSLANSEQAILFQNRRGFSPFLQCGTCAWIPHCIYCDVSLTYHKLFNRLNCHYCGYSKKIPENCPACGDTNMLTKGFGTEKIAEELAIYFPNAKIARMDLDTTRSKYAYQSIINDFETGKVDILVGTQMITKGLDFDNVSVVGILNADTMLNFPDFRSFERSFQLMAQVSGRAGRKKKRGKVVVQTYNPAHSIVQNVVNNDYQCMYENEIVQREKFKYPPYYRLIEITLKHKNYKLLDKSATELCMKLKRKFGKRVLGPVSPVVGRVKSQYLKKLLIKLEKEASGSKAKNILTEIINGFKITATYKSVRVQVDVDPM